MALDRTRHPRRRFLRGGLALAGLGLLPGCSVPPLPWQPPPRVRRVGYLTIGAPPANRRPRIEHVKETLRDLGWIEDRDIVYEPRYPEKAEDMPAAADELIRLPVDLIIVAGLVAARAAKAATRTIPIVMTTVGDAQASGLVTNLARPEGNITGFTIRATDIQKKCLQLLTECVSGVSRVALLFDSTDTGLTSTAEDLGAFQAASQTLGVELVPVATTGPADYPRAFSDIAAQGLGAVHILPSSPASNNITPIAKLALDARLPAVLTYREFPFAGGLLSLGIDFDDVWHRAAVPIDKILRGARPGDIPVEQPTTYEVIVNVKTAHTLGLSIPESVLLLATEIIQ
jgi:putative tryptophan/tyrosine transport system substrate-binding protein